MSIKQEIPKCIKVLSASYLLFLFQLCPLSERKNSKVHRWASSICWVHSPNRCETTNPYEQTLRVIESYRASCWDPFPTWCSPSHPTLYPSRSASPLCAFPDDFWHGAFCWTKCTRWLIQQKNILHLGSNNRQWDRWRNGIARGSNKLVLILYYHLGCSFRGISPL